MRGQCRLIPALRIAGISVAVLLALAPAAARAQASGLVGPVTATARTITVQTRLPAADDPATTSLALYDLDPAQDPSAYATLAPVLTEPAPLSSTSVELAIPR